MSAPSKTGVSPTSAESGSRRAGWATTKSAQTWDPTASPPATGSRWTASAAKRVFDLACAAPLLLLTLPLMACIAVAVKLGSPGPVLFRQRRCGRDGQEFELLKFRSMHHLRERAGPGLTRAGDARVTRAGRLLRKWKLDELPQLFNVLTGHLSMVGPRPDLPQYMNALDAELRKVLALTPGVTSAATLCFRHEEKLLASVPPERLEEFYVSSVLPQKVRLELEYAQRATMLSDLRLLLRTTGAILQ